MTCRSKQYPCLSYEEEMKKNPSKIIMCFLFLFKMNRLNFALERLIQWYFLSESYKNSLTNLISLLDMRGKMSKHCHNLFCFLIKINRLNFLCRSYFCKYCTLLHHNILEKIANAMLTYICVSLG